MDNSPKQLLELSEAARVAKVSAPTIRKWADSGRLAVAYKTGRGLRLIRPEDLEACLQDREAA